MGRPNKKREGLFYSAFPFALILKDKRLLFQRVKCEKGVRAGEYPSGWWSKISKRERKSGLSRSSEAGSLRETNIWTMLPNCKEKV